MTSVSGPACTHCGRAPMPLQPACCSDGCCRCSQRRPCCLTAGPPLPHERSASRPPQASPASETAKTPTARSAMASGAPRAHAAWPACPAAGRRPAGNCRLASGQAVSNFEPEYSLMGRGAHPPHPCRQVCPLPRRVPAERRLQGARRGAACAGPSHAPPGSLPPPAARCLDTHPGSRCRRCRAAALTGLDCTCPAALHPAPRRRDRLVPRPHSPTRPQCVAGDTALLTRSALPPSPRALQRPARPPAPTRPQCVTGDTAFLARTPRCAARNPDGTCTRCANMGTTRLYLLPLSAIYLNGPSPDAQVGALGEGLRGEAWWAWVGVGGQVGWAGMGRSGARGGGRRPARHVLPPTRAARGAHPPTASHPSPTPAVPAPGRCEARGPQPDRQAAEHPRLLRPAHARCAGGWVGERARGWLGLPPGLAARAHTVVPRGDARGGRAPIPALLAALHIPPPPRRRLQVRALRRRLDTDRHQPGAPGCARSGPTARARRLGFRCRSFPCARPHAHASLLAGHPTAPSPRPSPAPPPPPECSAWAPRLPPPTSAPPACPTANTASRWVGRWVGQDGRGSPRVGRWAAGFRSRTRHGPAARQHAGRLPGCGRGCEPGPSSLARPLHPPTCPLHPAPTVPPPQCNAAGTACTQCTWGRSLLGGACRLDCKRLFGIGCRACTASYCTAIDPV